MDEKLNLTGSTDHAHACHVRWVKRMNRNIDAPTRPDEWIDEPCGGCRFFITLSGALSIERIEAVITPVALQHSHEVRAGRKTPTTLRQTAKR